MFVEAIESVIQFTKPVHTISRNCAGQLSPGSATFFFINEFGVAVTCKHVSQMLKQAFTINEQYENFRADLNKLPNDNKKRAAIIGLETKYGYKKETIIQLKYTILNSFDHISEITFHEHPTIDLAVIEFKGFGQKIYQSHAKFVKDDNKIKQGKYLCRLGFPFPEFNNFKYNEQTDDIEWTQTGNQNSPQFPIDGIITRFVAGQDGDINSIEMSTPGLRGQSGGPLFDTNGLVYGMQSVTSHLHLGFDLHEHEVINNGQKKKVNNSPFLHVGHCIHVNKIKEFLQQLGIKFYEE